MGVVGVCGIQEVEYEGFTVGVPGCWLEGHAGRAGSPDRGQGGACRGERRESQTENAVSERDFGS